MLYLLMPPLPRYYFHLAQRQQRGALHLVNELRVRHKKLDKIHEKIERDNFYVSSPRQEQETFYLEVISVFVEMSSPKFPKSQWLAEYMKSAIELCNAISKNPKLNQFFKARFMREYYLTLHGLPCKKNPTPTGPKH